MAVDSLTFQVTFDAHDPARLGAFWAQVLGYIEQPPPPGFDDWDSFLNSVGVPESERDSRYALVDPAGKRPRLFLQRVPEGKTAKNRVHLDVNVGAGLDGEHRQDAVRKRAEELVGLGATLVEERQEMMSHWIVLQDPEGNEFCVQ